MPYPIFHGDHLNYKSKNRLDTVFVKTHNDVIYHENHNKRLFSEAIFKRGCHLKNSSVCHMSKMIVILSYAILYVIPNGEYFENLRFSNHSAKYDNFNSLWIAHKMLLYCCKFGNLKKRSIQ